MYFYQLYLLTLGKTSKKQVKVLVFMHMCVLVCMYSFRCVCKTFTYSSMFNCYTVTKMLLLLHFLLYVLLIFMNYFKSTPRCYGILSLCI